MNDSLEREVTTAFHEVAPSREPDHLFDSIVSATSSVRPRPRWLAIMKEPPMRRASRVVVGSPTVRSAVLLAAALLVALLSVGVLVVGAQSPSPVPEAAAPRPPVPFTGQFECGPEVRSGTEARTELVVDEGRGSVLQSRGYAWQQAIETNDPRLSGVQHYSGEGDTFSLSGSGGLEQRVVGWVTVRIENAGGAWQGGMVDLFREGEVENLGGTYVLAGEGSYEGLTAIYEIVDQPSDCVFGIEGLIFEGDVPIAEPFTAG
jgi:hypothetical protein